ncbi:MAG: DUF4430 domain-containing protein [Clostridia bacterium]|nr:DUF4430 domain-containing protein [Clostridia bacterium]
MKIAIAVIAFILVIGLVAGAYFAFGPKTIEGSKSVTVIFTDNSGVPDTYVIDTDALYLAGAMTQAGLKYETKDTYVTAINGITADYDKDKSYWAFYVNDEYCNYGIFEQPVKDGDIFRIEYTIYEG